MERRGVGLAGGFVVFGHGWGWDCRGGGELSKMRTFGMGSGGIGAVVMMVLLLLLLWKMVGLLVRGGGGRVVALRLGWCS